MGSGEEGAEGGESWQRNGGGGGVTMYVCACVYKGGSEEAFCRGI